MTNNIIEINFRVIWWTVGTQTVSQNLFKVLKIKKHPCLKLYIKSIDQEEHLQLGEGDLSYTRTKSIALPRMVPLLC